jgi:hypothetical protein
MLGCFRLPIGYIAEDLKWGFESVAKGFNELLGIGFVTRDENTGWLIIHNFLKWNPIENPNQGKSIIRLFEHVPAQSTVYKPLVASLLEHGKYMDEPFLNRLQTLSQAFSNQDQDQKQDQEQDQDQEQEKNAGQTRPASNCEPNILHVFQHWKTTMQHDKAVLDSKRRSIIRKALQSGYTTDQLCDAITGCSYTPHNMGDNNNGQNYDGLHIILRDADQIDRFIKNYFNPPRVLNAAEKNLQANITTAQRWLKKKSTEEPDEHEK